MVILNLTPVPRLKPLGMPRPGKGIEVLNSDAAVFGGSNVGNMGGVVAEDLDCTTNLTRRNSPCRR